MKAIIEFNLPEDENEYAMALQAQRMQELIWTFSQQLRSWYKYGHDFKDSDDAVYSIREYFYELLRSRNIDLDL